MHDALVFGTCKGTHRQISTIPLISAGKVWDETGLYVQILVAVSFLLAGYQDIKERLVSDIVWIPAVAGVVFALYYLRGEFLVLIVPIALVGVMALGAAWLGLVGEADGIAFLLIIAGVAPLGLVPDIIGVFVGVLGALGIHVGYLYSRGLIGKRRVIPVSEFRKEPYWIPRALIIGGQRTEVVKDVNISRESVDEVKDETAMVEVQYGVPTVAYLAAGYLVYVAYLVVFQTGAFLGLP